MLWLYTSISLYTAFPLNNFQKWDCRCRWAFSFGIGEVWWMISLYTSNKTSGEMCNGPINLHIFEQLFLELLGALFLIARPFLGSWGYFKWFMIPRQSQRLLYQQYHRKDEFFLADPGEARGCSTNTSVIHSVMVCEFLLQFSKIFKILKGIQIALLVQKLRRFWWMGGFCLLVELHREGSAPAACAAGLFIHRQRD